MPNGDLARYEDAIAAFAAMVGALILARAVSDEDLSDLILKSTRQSSDSSAAKSRTAGRRSLER